MHVCLSVGGIRKEILQPFMLHCVSCKDRMACVRPLASCSLSSIPNGTKIERRTNAKVQRCRRLRVRAAIPGNAELLSGFDTLALTAQFTSIAFTGLQLVQRLVYIFRCLVWFGNLGPWCQEIRAIVHSGHGRSGSLPPGLLPPWTTIRPPMRNPSLVGAGPPGSGVLNPCLIDPALQERTSSGRPWAC